MPEVLEFEPDPQRPGKYTLNPPRQTLTFDWADISKEPRKLPRTTKEKTPPATASFEFQTAPGGRPELVPLPDRTAGAREPYQGRQYPISHGPATVGGMTLEPSAMRGSPAARLGIGALGPVIDIGRFAAHGVAAPFEAAGYPGAAQAVTAGPEWASRALEAVSQQARRDAGLAPEDIDWYQTAGELASPGTWLGAETGGGLARQLARPGMEGLNFLLRGGLSGAGAGATQPVGTGEPYMETKALQTGVGAMLGPLAEAIPEAAGAIGRGARDLRQEIADYLYRRNIQMPQPEFERLLRGQADNIRRAQLEYGLGAEPREEAAVRAEAQVQRERLGKGLERRLTTAARERMPEAPPPAGEANLDDMMAAFQARRMQQQAGSAAEAGDPLAEFHARRVQQMQEAPPGFASELPPEPGAHLTPEQRLELERRQQFLEGVEPVPGAPLGNNDWKKVFRKGAKQAKTFIEDERGSGPLPFGTKGRSEKAAATARQETLKSPLFTLLKKHGEIPATDAAFTKAGHKLRAGLSFGAERDRLIKAGLAEKGPGPVLRMTEEGRQLLAPSEGRMRQENAKLAAMRDILTLKTFDAPENQRVAFQHVLKDILHQGGSGDIFTRASVALNKRLDTMGISQPTRAFKMGWNDFRRQVEQRLHDHYRGELEPDYAAKLAKDIGNRERTQAAQAKSRKAQTEAMDWEAAQAKAAQDEARHLETPAEPSKAESAEPYPVPEPQPGRGDAAAGKLGTWEKAQTDFKRFLKDERGTLTLPKLGASGEARVNTRGPRAGRISKRPVPLKVPPAPDKWFSNIERIFSPSTGNEASRAGARIMRTMEGQHRRLATQVETELAPYQAAVNKLTPAQQLDLINHVQTGAGTVPPELASLVKDLKTVYDTYAKAIGSLQRFEQMTFHTDYMPQLWEDKVKARNVYASGIYPSEGTRTRATAGVHQKARTYNTYAEGIAAGLTPLTTDPIDLTLRYVAAMRSFLTKQYVLEEAKGAGYIKYKQAAKDMPPGTEYLPGPVKNGAGQLAYGSKEFVRAYRNWTSSGFEGLGEEFGDAYNALLRMNNAQTAIVLGLSGFHAATMATEAAYYALADGVMAMARGRPITAVKKFAEAPIAAATIYSKGRQITKQYLGEHDFGHDIERLADFAARANLRVHGLEDIYRASAAGGYFRQFPALDKLKDPAAWARFGESLKHEAAATAKGLDPRKPLTALKTVATTAGRLIETVAEPLFYHYIPRVKAGAFATRMERFLRDNPTASVQDQVAHAQMLADVIDDQFGEMMQNNVFWNKLAKQIANVMLTSTGWTLGTQRLFLQGGYDLLTKLPRGKLTDRAAYIIAMLAGGTAIRGTYQYLSTGQMPESVSDLFWPRTGGTTQHGAPERAQFPGYEKEVGWFHDPVSEAYNKLSPSVKMGYELAHNKDWRGHDIAISGDPVLKQVQDYGKFILQHMMPISFSVAGQEQPGSNIGTAARFMGVRPAGGWIAEPERAAGFQKKHARKELQFRMREEGKERRRIEGLTQKRKRLEFDVGPVR